MYMWQEINFANIHINFGVCFVDFLLRILVCLIFFLDCICNKYSTTAAQTLAPMELLKLYHQELTYSQSIRTKSSSRKKLFSDISRSFFTHQTMVDSSSLRFFSFCVCNFSITIEFSTVSLCHPFFLSI